ncbi:EF-hand [Xylariaceae sp. FL0016]|nr:EF-hand [Xylariaceae sp. FL0016]
MPYPLETVTVRGLGSCFKGWIQLGRNELQLYDMASFSSAASTLTRPRVAIAVVSTLAAISLTYLGYVQYVADYEEPIVSGPGLHRSNALRRPRRSSQRDDSSESESHGDENIDNGPPNPIREALAQVEDQNPGDWYNDPSQRPSRTGENIVTLLFRVSEDSARRNAYVHRGCQCNGCGMVPIRGIRYRCANCADFDLCEVCESQGLHNKTHVFYKVRVPAPPFGPRHVQPAWYPGDPDNALRTLPRHLLLKWTNETGFERAELEAFWEQWTFMANTEWRDDPNGLGLAMDRKTFERCLVPSGGYRHAAPNLIHDRMFAFYDTNQDDLIGFEEFLHGVSYRKRKDKLRKTYDGYDIDGDGFVSRRDFLRMFRAYYVLYKQMHRDILEGLDDHMMTTTEAQQLISSRQPLSSLFGREGRVPGADHGRPMEGKIFRSNGDVDVHDGKGVVNEDKPDTSNREAILNGLLGRTTPRSMFTESFGSSSRRPHSSGRETLYYSGIINPPRNTVDLGSLLQGDIQQLDDIIDTFRHDDRGAFLAADADTASSSSDDGSAPEDQVDNQVDERSAEASNSGEAGDSLEQRPIPDAAAFANILPRSVDVLRPQPRDFATNGNRLSLERQKRILARKQLHERWKRRQFYLDEEEGSTPPQGWDEGKDILANLKGMPESSKSTQTLISPRSRSSSKVRFAEDTDDFEVRSNPSTSSRSVPERWGGMEIPDAERDAGKEILYQVTQQAFNELLDEVFKKKEDLAIRAAETKEQRGKYRALLETIEADDDNDTDAHSSKDLPADPQAQETHQTRARPIPEQSLEELLETSGYQLRTPDDQSEMPAPEATETAVAPSLTQDTEVANELSHDYSGNEDETASAHDPTMPQFRPNRLPSKTTDCSVSPFDGVREPSAVAEQSSGDVHVTESKIITPIETEHVPHATLLTWKRLDYAEEEAQERGGWGRLSFEEFEQIYREHEFQDSSRNRLDYLGSWIDFCIP